MDILANSASTVKFDERMDGQLYRNLLRLVDAEDHADRVTIAWRLLNKLQDYKLVKVSEII